MTHPFPCELTPSSPDFPGYKQTYELTPKDTWTFPLYKTYQWWSFNLWECHLYDEGLLNGTEKSLDYWYKQLSKGEPNYTSEMYGTFTTKKLEGLKPTTTLTFQHPDPKSPKSSYYLDEGNGNMCWLCPLLQQLFGESPQTLYLYLTPFN